LSRGSSAPTHLETGQTDATARNGDQISHAGARRAQRQATLGKNMCLAGPNEAYTVTFGDRAENEVGMQIIGTAASTGLSVAALHAIAAELRGSEVINLTTLLGGCAFPRVPEAAVLVVRGGVATLLGPAAESAICAELHRMPKDTTSLYMGAVKNKRARHNNCIADYEQAPDIANGRGTVVRFGDYPHVDALRTALTQRMRSPPLVGELNHYFNANTCGIRWHGDAERRLVAGARFGAGANGMPFKMQWFYRGEPVGNEARIELSAGDIYILSDKAVGYDWQSSSTLTLRHAAGKDSCEYARTERKHGEAHPVTVFAPPKPLTEEQRVRVEASKRKAMAIRASREAEARKTRNRSL